MVDKRAYFLKKKFVLTSQHPASGNVWSGVERICGEARHERSPQLSFSRRSERRNRVKIFRNSVGNTVQISVCLVQA